MEPFKREARLKLSRREYLGVRLEDGQEPVRVLGGGLDLADLVCEEMTVEEDKISIESRRIGRPFVDNQAAGAATHQRLLFP